MTTNGRMVLEQTGQRLDEILQLARAAQVPESTAAFALLIDQVASLQIAIEALKAATIQPPLLDDVKGPEVLIFSVTVTVAGLTGEVQGPPIALPRGYNTLVRVRYNTGSPTGYVSFQSKGTQHTGVRSEIRNNDSISVYITNLSHIYLAADTANTVFELISSYASKA